MSKPISEESAMMLLPGVLAQDEGMRQLAEVTAKDIDGMIELANMANIFSRIQELDEEMLDLLAEMLNVDWYETDADVETKRTQIESSWYVHRKRGTKAAVVQAFKDVWQESSVSEWWEYGGQPYHFRVSIAGELTPENIERCTRILEKVKNARSMLDAVEYMAEKADVHLYTAALVSCTAISTTAQIVS